mmetsp:Transcript_81809/g.227835  ORF Transcript_81809/g.227835 Transcript_81809/m.227835 type:complete len:170 (-) Transcript_81809:96-605(-)|eukprot:CAMPEP_0117570172 /NCGR_PEP_ID=MMETSP0784-20121206/59055_1 /TAXON_ID=39447 /ORGANISM="" /LENGTH=169 /DNA_ID=CAMNT_0005368205 /DNA_START=47 /DNA_END=556 /DNA_ORIENTATION=+
MAEFGADDDVDLVYVPQKAVEEIAAKLKGGEEIDRALLDKCGSAANAAPEEMVTPIDMSALDADFDGEEDPVDVDIRVDIERLVKKYKSVKGAAEAVIKAYRKYEDNKTKKDLEDIKPMTAKEWQAMMDEGDSFDMDEFDSEDMLEESEEEENDEPGEEEPAAKKAKTG